MNAFQGKTAPITASPLETTSGKPIDGGTSLT